MHLQISPEHSHVNIWQTTLQKHPNKNRALSLVSVNKDLASCAEAFSLLFLLKILKRHLIFNERHHLKCLWFLLHLQFQTLGFHQRGVPNFPSPKLRWTVNSPFTTL